MSAVISTRPAEFALLEFTPPGKEPVTIGVLLYEAASNRLDFRLRREDVERALGSLPRREREVIELRFGLNGKKPRTLEEVGQAFGVTRERIRQIENNTLKKLETLPEAQGLRDCI